MGHRQVTLEQLNTSPQSVPLLRDDSFAKLTYYKEISRLSGSKIVWTTQCDVFSFGCEWNDFLYLYGSYEVSHVHTGTIHSLCALKPPFSWHMKSPDEIYEPLSELYSADLKRFISSCLAFRPESRPDAFQITSWAQFHIPEEDLKELSSPDFQTDGVRFNADVALLRAGSAGPESSSRASEPYDMVVSTSASL